MLRVIRWSFPIALGELLMFFFACMKMKSLEISRFDLELR